MDEEDGDETLLRQRLNSAIDVPQEFVERQVLSRREQRIRHRWCSKLRLQRNLLTASVLKSFIENINVAVLLQITLAVICTVVCQLLDLELNAQMTLFVSPIVFPLAFSINACYQRREKVLDDLANLKAAAMIIFFCHRDWWKQAGLSEKFISNSLHTLGQLMDSIRSYLLTSQNAQRIPFLGRIYLCMSEVALLNDKLRESKSLPSNGPLVTRLIHYNNIMCWSFERLRVVREYRSPRTIRAFTKVLIFILPLLLAPYYVYVGRSSVAGQSGPSVTTDSPTAQPQSGSNRGAVWPSYFLAVLVSFVFGSLQAVEDALDDPFDGISEDDINLDQLQDWACFTFIVSPSKSVPASTLDKTKKEWKKRTGSATTDNEDGLSQTRADDAAAIEFALSEIASQAKGELLMTSPMMLPEYDGSANDGILFNSPSDSHVMGMGMYLPKQPAEDESTPLVPPCGPLARQSLSSPDSKENISLMEVQKTLDSLEQKRIQKERDVGANPLETSKGWQLRSQRRQYSGDVWAGRASPVLHSPKQSDASLLELRRPYQSDSEEFTGLGHARSGRRRSLRQNRSRSSSLSDIAGREDQSDLYTVPGVNSDGESRHGGIRGQKWIENGQVFTYVAPGVMQTDI